MLYQIELAGIVIEINITQQSTICFMQDFVVEEKKPAFSIKLHSSDIEHELQQWHIYDENIIIPDRISISPVLERQTIYHKILEKLPSYSTILMHGAVLADSSNAFMFSAPSGVGKTTRAKLLLENHNDLFFLNGDKPLIRVEDNRVIACGSPWKGKEGYGTNEERPLKVIFFLERADFTKITEISLSEAFENLIKQTYIPENHIGAIKTINLLKALQGKVRFFRFQSCPTIESVEAAWRTIYQM